MAVDFDLTLFIKETQLQHGLRAEDYVRYHHYITNRLAALRKQLNLSNDKKKFLHKDVTAQNATDARHLMLLALYAERCWAEAETMQVRLQAKKEARGGDINKPKGGVAPADQYRKRLNKSVKWASKLREVANAVASERVQKECTAYLNDAAGRCAAAHGKFKEAKDAFLLARETYATLRSTSTEMQWVVIASKINELDDRVTYCMQRLGEDPTSYHPPAIFQSSNADDATEEGSTQVGGASQLLWNGRTLTVFSIKVKDALREAQSVEVESTQAKLYEARGPVPVGQSNRVLDLMDRRINYYNDALVHARQDLRAAPEGAGKTEYQLIVHYILFHVAHETLRRTLFLAALYSRRFAATERTLRGGITGRCGGDAAAAAYPQSTSSRVTKQQQPQQRRKKSEIAPTQFASPLEVVRLYQAAAGNVEEMELLPGVAGRDDVASLQAVCLAGQLFYTGESWRVSQEWATAMSFYRDALALLREVSGPYVAELREHIEQRLMQGAAEVVLVTSSAARHTGSDTGASSTSAAATIYLNEAGEETVAVAQGIMRFPPDYQAAPCKPIFVDVASTFVDYPAEEETVTASVPVASQKGSASGNNAAKTKEEKKKGWFGWGS
jgi:signal recognition particle subunit SRP68